MALRWLSTTAAVVVTATALAACSEDGAGSRSAEGPGTSATPSPTTPTPSAPEPSGPSEPSGSSPTATPGDEPAAEATGPSGPAVSDGRPRPARMTIPALGVRDLLVTPYAGHTDDAAGTRIQDRGEAASPHGPRGGVGPGGVGNYQVTGHRTSSSAPFAELPRMRRGDRVLVEAGGVRYVYEIRSTRETSFRSARSLAEQRAAVPGRPGARPTKAYLTLSTCATPEDHAAGNYWSDALHNPEHRIDKIGVLVRTVAV